MDSLTLKTRAKLRGILEEHSRKPLKHAPSFWDSPKHSRVRFNISRMTQQVARAEF